MDLTFVGQNGYSELMLILVLQEDHREEIFIHGLESKRAKGDDIGRGQGLCMVKRALGDVESLGYKKIIMKSDHEPVMRALRLKVKQLWGGESIPQHSAVKSPASHSMAGRTFREAQAQLRVVLIALQARVCRKVDMRLTVAYRMVEYAGELINRCKRGQDGLTTRECKYGKPDYMGLIEFGEVVYFLPQVHGAGGKRNSRPVSARASF